MTNFNPDCLTYWKQPDNVSLENHCLILITLRDLGGPFLVTWHRKLVFLRRFCIAREETPLCVKPLKTYRKQSWRWTWTRGKERGNSCACL